MAEDEDKPEDEIEDEDDSDLFEPPTADPLGDALADAAAGDMAGDMAGAEEDGEAEEQKEDDSDLFAPPAGEADEPETEADEPEPEAPVLGGHQPVLPVTDGETGSQDDAQDEYQDQDADLFGAPGGEDEDQDGDPAEAVAGDPAEAVAGDPDEDEESTGEARQRYPWLQRSDEPEEPEEEEHSLQGRTLIFVGAGVVFVIFAALIWFLYSTGDEPPRDQDVALIEAPEGPAKVEPEDRGGMEIPDQDKLVFDRVSGQKTQLEENLLAGPEEPVALPDLAPDSLDELVQALVDDSGPVAVPEPLAVAAEPAASVESAPVETVPVETAPVETAPPPAAATPAPTRAGGTRAGGTHVVQLGSYGSLERAGTAWRVVKNRHSIILAGLDNDIQRADLGARGVFYRLRTEPLGSGEARDLCADLKAAGQDCLVVRR